uniref:Putative group i salivary lipocalin n=1 Tax=Rhipicephalus pulchellus TaxID=72859 RepID=L7LT31_RHIPC
MVRLVFLCGVLCVLLLTTPSHQHEGQGNRQDIVRFLNTTEKIWTWKSTSTVRTICKVDIKSDINATNIAYTRSILEGRYYWTKKELRGKFFNWNSSMNTISGSYDAVDLATRGGRGAGVEVLHYVSANFKCAVLFILGDGRYPIRPWYDMRVWDSSTQNGPDEDCKRAFENVTIPKERKQSYYRGCPNATAFMK